MQLSEQAKDLRGDTTKAENFPKPPDSDEKPTQNRNLLFDTFITNQSEPEKSLKLLKNFSHEQFHFLLETVKPDTRFALYSVRGRKCQDTIQDLLFILLATVKHKKEWVFPCINVQKKKQYCHTWTFDDHIGWGNCFAFSSRPY